MKHQTANFNTTLINAVAKFHREIEMPLKMPKQFKKSPISFRRKIFIKFV
jgi:hypothetical protein